MTSGSDPRGILARLIGTGVNTGIFRVEVDVYYSASSPFSKRIMAGFGDTITAISVDNPAKQDTTGVPMPEINVTHIKFNHDTSSAETDGVN